MEKFENVKSIENLIEMGDDAVIEFVNKILDMIENREIRIDEIKARFGFNITEARSYLAGKYATTGGRFIKKQKTCRKRKSKQATEKPALTDAEILELKKLIANKPTAPVRNQKHCELALGEKEATICIHITKKFQEQFKEYCGNNRQYNQSEHVMLAVMEYMEKYKMGS